MEASSSITNQPAKSRLRSRFATFLSRPHGQKFTTSCAYSALTCLTISLFLTDYSRLALPFAIAALPLAYLGHASRSRRSLAQVALALLVISFNILFRTLFNLGEQSAQLPHIQQQLIQLENQHNDLQLQKAALAKQQSILQPLFDQATSKTGNPHTALALYGALATTSQSLTQLQGALGATNVRIERSLAHIKDGNRNLPDDSRVQTDQLGITWNDDQIQANQQLIGNVNQIIVNDNAFLSLSQTIHLPLWTNQMICVSGYPCRQFSWQQPFIDGWHTITTEPLSTTWFFWLSLLLALPGMFFLLPRGVNNVANMSWTVTYRMRYFGPLSQLNDPVFPDQKRQTWPSESSIVKITVTSTHFLRKQDGMGDDAQDFLYLNLGLGTTVHDVFLAQNSQQLSENLPAVSYDTTTGNIVVKVKPITPVEVKTMRQARALRKANLPRQFPIQIYAIVDYFAGSLDAATPLSDIAQLREQRGPSGLLILAGVFQQLLWWIYALGFYFALMSSSTIFFEGSAPSSQLLLWLGLGGLMAGLVLKILELIITKATTRRSPSLPLNMLAS